MPTDSVLFITMYPLDALDKAPKVRSYHLWRELALLVSVTLVDGGKMRRLWRFLRLMATGRLFRFRAAYVESSSMSASPADILVFAIFRLLGRPVLIYVRDAYPLFARQFPPRSVKQRIGHWGWRLSFQSYRRLATKLLFPTTGLAELFDLPSGRRGLLPPGGSLLVERPTLTGTRRVAYVGPLSDSVMDLLQRSMLRVRERCGPQAKCTIVAPLREWESAPHMHAAEWCEYREASRQGLAEALADVDICVIPRPVEGYYPLTLPIKLFDYMSLGKAVVTTNLPSVAKIVKGEKVGIVADDDTESFAEAIVNLFDQPHQVKRFQLNAVEAIRTRHSWRNRAECLLEMMNAGGAGLTPRHEKSR